jgi:hypothetical protein
MAVEIQDQGTAEGDDDEEVQVVRSRTRPSTVTASTEEGATLIHTSAAATGGTRLRKYGTARVNSASADAMDTQQQGEDTAEMMDLDADSVSTAQRGRRQRGTDAEVAQVSDYTLCTDQTVLPSQGCSILVTVTPPGQYPVLHAHTYLTAPT